MTLCAIFKVVLDRPSIKYCYVYSDHLVSGAEQSSG